MTRIFYKYLEECSLRRERELTLSTANNAASLLFGIQLSSGSASKVHSFRAAAPRIVSKAPVFGPLPRRIASEAESFRHDPRRIVSKARGSGPAAQRIVSKDGVLKPAAPRIVSKVVVFRGPEV